MYGEESPVAPERESPAGKSPWRGGGGRWTVWPLRVVLWLAIIVIGYRGIMAIVLNETPSSTAAAPAPAAPAPASKFPVTLAEAYALQFGQVYLNFNPATAGSRAQQLASFLPSSVSQQQSGSQFGWNGSGSAHLGSEQVAGIDVRSPTTAVVTLLATVNDKLMELGVPIYASGGNSLAVSGQPAWLPAPSTAQPPAVRAPTTDQTAQAALQSQLPAFFTAYANGDQSTLNQYLVSGASITGLNGAVRFGSIGSITVPEGGNQRDITVTVNWLLPGQSKQAAGQLTTTYDMSVVDQQSGKWYVEDIRASTQPMGTQ